MRRSLRFQILRASIPPSSSLAAHKYSPTHPWLGLQRAVPPHRSDRASSSGGGDCHPLDRPHHHPARHQGARASHGSTSPTTRWPRSGGALGQILLALVPIATQVCTWDRYRGSRDHRLADGLCFRIFSVVKRGGTGPLLQML